MSMFPALQYTGYDDLYTSISLIILAQTSSVENRYLSVSVNSVQGMKALRFSEMFNLRILMSSIISLVFSSNKNGFHDPL